MTPEECRAILGVARDALIDDLKRAKRQLLLRYHPDQNPERRAWADERTRAVLRAYDLLAAALPDPCEAAGASPRRAGGAARFAHGTGPATPKPPRPAAAHKPLSYVVVLSHGQLLALPVHAVVQVAPLAEETVVGAGGGRWAFALGQIRFNGMRLPLVDLGAALGFSGARLGECRHFVVLNAKAGQVALAVDQVQQVVNVNATAIEPAEQVLPCHGGLLKGAFRLESDSVVIPDLDALLS